MPQSIWFHKAKPYSCAPHAATIFQVLGRSAYIHVHIVSPFVRLSRYKSQRRAADSTFVYSPRSRQQYLCFEASLYSLSSNWLQLEFNSRFAPAYSWIYFLTRRTTLNVLLLARETTLLIRTLNYEPAPLNISIANKFRASVPLSLTEAQFGRQKVALWALINSLRVASAPGLAQKMCLIFWGMTCATLFCRINPRSS